MNKDNIKLIAGGATAIGVGALVGSVLNAIVPENASFVRKFASYMGGVMVAMYAVHRIHPWINEGIDKSTWNVIEEAPVVEEVENC